MASPPVILDLILVRLSGRNYPNNSVVLSIAVAYDQNAEFKTHAQHNKSVFVLRMVRVEKANGVLVQKYRLGFLERDAVFPYVFPILACIPLEPQVIHIYNVCKPLNIVNIIYGVLDRNKEMPSKLGLLRLIIRGSPDHLGLRIRMET